MPSRTTSIAVATTFGATDVNIKTPEMRRVVNLNVIVAFVYNSVIGWRILTRRGPLVATVLANDWTTGAAPTPPGSAEGLRRGSTAGTAAPGPPP